MWCWNAGEFTPETWGGFTGVREKCCCLSVSLSMAFKVSTEAGLDKEIWGAAEELLGSKELFKLVIGITLRLGVKILAYSFVLISYHHYTHKKV